MTSKTRQMLVKVPAVTAFFWIIKVLATTVGETFADFLNGLLSAKFNLTDAQGLQLVSAIMGSVLVVIMIAQLIAKRYIPWLYWLAIVFISVAGTLVTDNLHDGFGVELWVTTVAFAAILAVVFGLWYAQEKTLAMKSISTTKREVYYWLAILFTFALGTSAGDQLAESVNIGYGPSLLVFAAAIGVVFALWRIKIIGEITAFWIAYILTRPLGASLGDLLSQAPKHGGIGLGANNTSYLFLGLILALVIYLSTSKKDEIK